MPKPLRRVRLPILALICALGVAGCAIYKPEVPQGNVITADMLDTLKIGMSKQQVRFLLGTPAIIDSFHEDRWDYVYWAPQGPRPLTLFFQGDQLIRLDRTAEQG